MKLKYDHLVQRFAFNFNLRLYIWGNARAAVIACISPAAEMAEDSRSTLRFAERCTLVQNHATLNQAEVGVHMKEALRRAQAEADGLRPGLSYKSHTSYNAIQLKKRGNVIGCHSSK